MKRWCGHTKKIALRETNTYRENPTISPPHLDSLPASLSPLQDDVHRSRKKVHDTAHDAPPQAGVAPHTAPGEKTTNVVLFQGAGGTRPLLVEKKETALTLPHPWRNAELPFPSLRPPALLTAATMGGRLRLDSRTAMVSPGRTR